MKKKGIKVNTYAVITIVNILVFLLLFVLCFNRSIWKDEVFDLKLIRNSYSYFVLQSRDSAPPLHFIFLKFFVELAQRYIPQADTYIVAKLASLFPYIILFVLSHTIIKKIWGETCGALVGLFSVTMPSLFPFWIMIRQYSWSIVVAVIWYISFYYLIEKKSIASSIVAAITGCLALWTHYYIFFGVAFAYIVLFIYSIKKKDGKGIRAACIASFLSAAIYIWWVIIAYDYVVNDVNTTFHIPITLENSIYTFLYMIFPDSNKFGIGYIFGIAGLVILGIMVFYLCKSDGDHLFELVGIGIPYFTSVCGILIGLFIAPCFQPRYLIPILGCFWFGFSVILTKVKMPELLRTAICLFLIMIGFIDVFKGTKDELEYWRNIDSFEEFLDANEGAFVLDDSRVDTCLPFYTDREWVVVSEEFGDMDNKLDDIAGRVSEGEVIYYVRSQRNNKGRDLSEDIRQRGMNSVKVYEGGIEYLFFDIYRLEKE